MHFQPNLQNNSWPQRAKLLNANYTEITIHVWGRWKWYPTAKGPYGLNL